MTKRLTSALLLASLMATGCAQVDKYPDAWDRINIDNAAGRCPLVSGLYENNGAKPDGTKISLAVWLAAAAGRSHQEERNNARNHFIGELFKAEVVEVNLIAEDRLFIQASGKGIAIPWEISKNAGQFECKDGALIIRSGGNISGDNVAGFSSGSMKLYSGHEHLIVNWKEGAAGVMLFVPAVVYSDIWARFVRRP